MRRFGFIRGSLSTNPAGPTRRGLKGLKPVLSDKNSFLSAFALALVAAGFAGVWACNGALFNTEALETAILRMFIPGMILMVLVTIRIVMVFRGRNEMHLIFNLVREWKTLPKDLQLGLWVVVLPIGTAICFALAAAFCLDMG